VWLEVHTGCPHCDPLFVKGGPVSWLLWVIVVVLVVVLLVVLALVSPPGRRYLRMRRM
jgi:hypothetical protein